MAVTGARGRRSRSRPLCSLTSFVVHWSLIVLCCLPNKERQTDLKKRKRKGKWRPSASPSCRRRIVQNTPTHYPVLRSLQRHSNRVCKKRRKKKRRGKNKGLTRLEKIQKWPFSFFVGWDGFLFLRHLPVWVIPLAGGIHLHINWRLASLNSVCFFHNCIPLSQLRQAFNFRPALHHTPPPVLSYVSLRGWVIY